MNAAELPTIRLRRRFNEAKKSASIRGASVLQELSDIASLCINGPSNAQDTAAFVLSDIFQQHSEDRTKRIVTVDDSYQLLAAGEEHPSEAVEFIEKGGNVR
jgi:hypothetical protein